MEQKEQKMNSFKKSLYNDPNANFRVKVENSKRQYENSRAEGIIKNNIKSTREIISSLKLKN